MLTVTTRPITSIAVCTSLLVSVANTASSDEQKKPERKLPKSGLLSVSSVSGASSSVTGDLFGGDDLFGGERAPITGSVSRSGESNWNFSVSNNSTDRYSINVDLIQKNELGSTVKFSSYSYTLRPGQSDGGSAQAGLNASKAELHLRSYRNLSERDKLLTPTAVATVGQ